MARFVGLLAALLLLNTAWAAEDLPSWNDTAARQRIVEFVKAVSDKKSKDYVPLAERIAVFDNDGTLWSEPKFKRPYTDLVFKPMQELLAYLRVNGFKTFIVSGGSVEFMRPWAEKAYGDAARRAGDGGLRAQYLQVLRRLQAAARHARGAPRRGAQAPAEEALGGLDCRG